VGDITRAELAALGLRAAALAGISDADQDAEIEASTGLCRAYLRQRYQSGALAAAVLDPAYKGALAKIATHRLLSTRGYDPAAGADVVVLTNHDASLRFLRDVSKGLASLDVSDTTGVGFADVLDSSDGVGIMSDEPRSG
jgi:hypothetical protein